MTSFMQRTLAGVRPNESVRQMMALKVAEKRRLLRYLHNFNASIGTHGQEDAVIPIQRRLFSKRGHLFQLPCCAMTRQKRALWMEDRGWIHESILLLGDDDLLAVELCTRGFSNVTVVDCDANVLHEIKRRCRYAAKPPWLIQADLASPSFHPPGDATVVCFDPPQNIRGVKVFFEAALQAVAGSRQATLLMMANPCAIGPSLQLFYAELAQRGIQLKHHQPFFNAYPVRGWEKVLLRAALWLFHGFRTRSSQGVFFGSDLFEFQWTKSPMNPVFPEKD